MKKSFIYVLLFIASCNMYGTQNKPNIIVIMADDMGYGDASCYGGKTQTPNIDRMAKEGMRFTDFHSSGTVCSPSRAGFVTGRYQQQSTVDGVLNADPEHPAHHLGLDPETQVTYPPLLNAAGYKTALFGKWHLGYLEKYNPMNYEFDRFVGFVSGNIDYISHYDRMDAYDWWHNREQVVEEGYSTHLITKHAVDYIRTHKDSPFCIYIAHEAVHSPMQGPNDLILRGPEATSAENAKKKERKPELVFADMLVELDKGVGEVLNAVQEAGIASNTFIFFTSDNGPMPYASAGPLKGKKGSLFEGGHRVPGIAWWPGKIKADTVTETFASALDLVPTMIEISEAKAPEGHQFDGQSLMPLFAGDNDPFGNTPRVHFWRNGGLGIKSKSLDAKDSWKAIRKGKWKLIAMPYCKKLMLFNLEEDIGETKNISDQYPEMVQELKDELIAWEDKMLPYLPYKVRR